MIAPVCRLVDWVAIEWAAARMPKADGREPHLAEMGQLLESPDFIPVAAEALVELSGPLRLRFETPRPCAIPENNTVHGRLYRCAERWGNTRPFFCCTGGMTRAIIIRGFRPWPGNSTASG